MVSSVAQMLMILAVPSTELALLISVLPLLLSRPCQLLRLLPRVGKQRRNGKVSKMHEVILGHARLVLFHHALARRKREQTR
jgi:hypothetical protein